jgi:CheY-like chemotaxis protein
MPSRVLIVEDAEPCASNLEIAFLSIPGIAVSVSASAQEAWRILESAAGAAVAALVTDLNMPRMDGYELIERVRADPRYADLPIIVVSGDTDPRTAERLRLLRADAYFEKPYSPSAVRLKLEQLLNAHTPSPIPSGSGSPGPKRG